MGELTDGDAAKPCQRNHRHNEMTGSNRLVRGKHNDRQAKPNDGNELCAVELTGLAQNSDCPENSQTEQHRLKRKQRSEIEPAVLSFLVCNRSRRVPVRHEELIQERLMKCEQE